jgi:hypothetical protein
MANDATEVRLAPDGQVYVAAKGSTLPTNATMALDSAFKELGYLDETGVVINPDLKLSDIMAWQSAIAIKTTLDTVKFEVKFHMMQVNTVTWGLYFFASTFTNNFGQAKLTLPSNPATQERALIIDWQDSEGDKNRLVLPTAVLTKREDLKLVRKDSQLAGVTFGVLDNSGSIGFIYSDNPDLVPSS